VYFCRLFGAECSELVREQVGPVVQEHTVPMCSELTGPDGVEGNPAPLWHEATMRERSRTSLHFA
jgi:hypothetical protein